MSVPGKGTSSFDARVNECELRGHNIGAIQPGAGEEIVFMCAKCGLSLDEIRGEEKRLVKVKSA